MSLENYRIFKIWFIKLCIIHNKDIFKDFKLNLKLKLFRTLNYLLSFQFIPSTLDNITDNKMLNKK